MEHIEKQLIGTAWPFWECEGEIAKRYFKTATKEDHIFYLRAQLWKELNPVDGYFNGLHKELENLVNRFGEIDEGIDRHEYHFLLTQLAEEFNHYVLLADIFEYATGSKIRREDTVQMSQEKILGHIRRDYVENGNALTRAAVGFTEGGGARLFREGSKLHGNVINNMTAKAMKTIFEDEKDHYSQQVKICIKLIDSTKDLIEMQKAIEIISLQRVAMRAEMFPGAMSEEEIKVFLKQNSQEL
tara:strand:- start:86 stop:814 length:729 start_codon:yes stop_codon:yes gene_type:complete